MIRHDGDKVLARTLKADAEGDLDVDTPAPRHSPATTVFTLRVKNLSAGTQACSLRSAPADPSGSLSRAGPALTSRAGTARRRPPRTRRPPDSAAVVRDDGHAEPGSSPPARPATRDVESVGVIQGRRPRPPAPALPHRRDRDRDVELGRPLVGVGGEDVVHQRVEQRLQIRGMLARHPHRPDPAAREVDVVGAILAPPPAAARYLRPLGNHGQPVGAGATSPSRSERRAFAHHVVDHGSRDRRGRPTAVPARPGR